MSIATNKIIHQALALVKPRFRLSLDHGHHGIKHWVRVWANAEMLCRHYSVNPVVPCWFAFLHDSQRMNEYRDHDHGGRAAAFAWANWSKIGLTTGQMNELDMALQSHSAGICDAPSQAIAICWDADRLDLGRCDIRPDPSLLCTKYAREPDVIEAAFLRSRSWIRK